MDRTASKVEQIISSTCRKSDITAAVKLLIQQPKVVPEIWNIATSDKPYAWRAAWVLSTATAADSNITVQLIDSLYNILPKITGHGRIREFLKIIISHKLPSEPSAEVLNFCLNTIATKSYPVSLRMYSMDVAVKYCKRYPELAREISYLLEEVVTEAPTLATKKWAKRILNSL